MKNIYCLLFLIGLSFNVFSQTKAFESVADVLSYLSEKRTFTNANSNVTLTFSDMGTNLSTGKNNYNSPDVSILTISRAVLKYYLTSNPDRIVNFIVDLKANAILDKQDMKTIYKAFTFKSDY